MAAILQGPNRRPAMLAGFGLGAVVILFLGSRLLGGGGGGTTTTTTVAADGGSAVAPGASAGGGGQPFPISAVAESFEVFTVRDPFQPLLTAAAPGGTPAAPAGPIGTTGGTGGTGTTGPTGPTGPSVARVALLEIFVDSGVTKARVRVDSTIYTVREGDAFATNFLVVLLNDPCGVFLHADVRFSLCEGQEVIT